ncbi:MAG: flavin reductase family protein [Candidatus Hodarchaeales archaeon]|jgi:flavin reductase (DIM6/NTAB) family NADH-FMN oxidoreductase RutF
MVDIQTGKQVFKEKNMLSPLPVVLVGANVDNHPNYLVIGYSSPFDFGRHIFFSLYKKRYTRIGIHQNQTFSVNIPSVDLLAETNICGSKSGRNFDKSSLFHTFYGKLKTAPLIHECPINIECEVTEILDYEQNEGIIGRVVKSYVHPKCLTDGKLDMRKVHPILWAIGGDNNYYQLGDRLHIPKS